MSSFNKSDSQLTASFFTKNKKYAIPDNPFSIPTSSDPDTFNSLIKSILKSVVNDDDKSEADLNEDLMSTEFDFYINGQFIYTSLAQFIEENENVKTESVIEIEYVERCPPPEPIDTLVVDDWVSSIRGKDDCILIGCYNNNVQIWSTNRQCLAKLSGHNGAVKTVNWVSTEDLSNKKNNAKKMKFISGSQDQSIIIWEWNQSTEKVEKTEKCIGHTESVECVNVSPDKSKVINDSIQ